LSLQECAYADLLSQKASIKSQQALLSKMRSEEASAIALAREKARQRVLEDFEKSQIKISSSSTSTSSGSGSSEKKEREEGRGVKRKFEIDYENLEKIEREAEDQARKKIEKEEAEMRRAKLPNFWLVRAFTSIHMDLRESFFLSSRLSHLPPHLPNSQKSL
jgi:nitric oxide synthase-interacting protein